MDQVTISSHIENIKTDPRTIMNFLVYDTSHHIVTLERKLGDCTMIETEARCL